MFARMMEFSTTIFGVLLCVCLHEYIKILKCVIYNKLYIKV